MMLRRFRFLIGMDSKPPAPAALPAPEVVRVPSAPPSPSPSLMSEGVQEIAIYIHRFHNLDLFQQGWYQIKVSMRWEGSDEVPPGFPSRVVQYEAPDSGFDDTAAVWKINDADHSFCTRPFRIKYARQDVFLSVMVSFNLPLSVTETFLTSAILLKFELLYAPAQDDMPDVQDVLEKFTASVHEIRVPSKALLGLHSYCPLHFDALHMVLVDLSVHAVLLKAASSISSKKLLSHSQLSENSDVEIVVLDSQAIGDGESGVHAMDIALWKTLCTARDILLKELKNLSKAIGQNVDDLDDMENMTIRSVSRKLDGLRARLSMTASEEDKWQYKSNDPAFAMVSRKEMQEGFQVLGSQLSSMWTAFLMFHRKNRTVIMEYLRSAWAEERSTEWSMWQVHSKMDFPQRHSNNGDEDTGWQSVRKAVVRKLNDDPAVSAASRAELHRKTIERMKINTRYLQDLQIFGKISQVPIVYIERHTVQCQRSHDVKEAITLGFSGSLEEAGASVTPKTAREKLPPKTEHGSGRSGRSLRVVVFVHGFQGHHLDLRLVRNQWLLIDPGAQCLMSEANEDRTSCDFRELGHRLAEEVVTYLKNKLSSGSRNTIYGSFRLSFVGHSIGNIIIRSALTDAAMKPYLNNLYTFLSISGPHLGYLYSSNTLFNSGLWLFKKLKGSPCMHQLTFTDEADIQNTFLYRLAQEKSLEYFQNVFLVSSPQDRYVPYHSARIEMCQAALRDSRKGPAYTTMLRNCLDQILLPSTADRTFIRSDVNFETSSQARTLNNIIGRTAHIEFLETDFFAKFIMWSFPKLFS